MKKFLILILMLAEVCRAEMPKLFNQKSFDAAALAEAVNHFVALGEKTAINELIALGSDENYNTDQGFNINERIGWVCGILFEPKDGKSLRQPRYGGLRLPWNTMPDKNWPLYPIALSGSTYFVLSEGYTLAGIAEKPKDYVAYCQTNGSFRKIPIKIPTREQGVNDAAVLRGSDVWKAIKWRDKGEGFSYAMDEESSWQFIQKQAESIR